MAAALEGVLEETQVERRVVRDEHASFEQAGERPRNVGEPGRVPDVRRGDPVDHLRPQITLRVYERRPRALDVSSYVDVHDRDLDDPIVPRRSKTGGLHVDDGISGHGCLSLSVGDLRRDSVAPELLRLRGVLTRASDLIGATTR